MTLIQVGQHSFSTRDPYSAGQSLGPVEAQVLNSTRASRIRNIMYKRLAKWSEPLSPSSLAEINEELESLDASFSLRLGEGGPKPKWGLQDEIRDVALEFVRATANRIGQTMSEDEVEETAKGLASDARVLAEAQRRFAAKQEIARQALEELF